MALRNNNFEVYSSSASGSGCGGSCGVMSLGMCGGFGISVTSSSTNPITESGTFTITNVCPYLGQSVIVLGSGTCSTLRCANNNTSSGNYSASLSGNFNSSLSVNSAISGGYSNTICYNNSDSNSFIGGGDSNKINSSNSVIFGGLCNNANFNQCFSGGGLGTTILGGQCHNLGSVNSGLFSFIGGGLCNQALGNVSNATSGCTIVILGGQCNYVCSCITSIGGGCQNCVTRSASSVIGGVLNVISSGGNCNIIGGGSSNQIIGSFSSIGGGITNNIFSSGQFNTMIGGTLSCITSNYSHIGGGQLNGIVCDFNTIFGGTLNKICFDNYNFLLGGSFNQLCGYSSSASGYFNSLTNSSFSKISGTLSCIENSTSSTILNGNQSYNDNSYSTIISASNSSVLGNRSDILGGAYNCNIGSCSTIINGCNNFIVNDVANNIKYGLSLNGCFNCLSGGSDNIYYSCFPIINGQSNYNNSSVSFLGNGLCNNLLFSNDYLSSYCGFGSGLVGGIGNNTYSGYFDNFIFTTPPQPQYVNQYSFVGGGFQNGSLSECFNSVIGGFCNRSFQKFSFIGGGSCNIVSVNSENQETSIFSGFSNSINNSNSFIGGGIYNCINDANNVILGGYNNQLLANISPTLYTNRCSFIGGGCSNIIYGNNGCSVILGGYTNSIIGSYNNIIGGRVNAIGNNTYNNIQFSNILGGTNNTNNGNSSSILGGSTNTNTTYNSFLSGSNISALYDCTTYVNNLNILATPNTCNPPNSINLGWDSVTKNVVAICDSTLTSFGLCSFTTASNIGLNVGGGSPISGANACGIICVNLGKDGGGLDTQYLSGVNSLESIPNVSSGGGVVYYLNGGTTTDVVGYYELSTDPLIGSTPFTFVASSDGVISQWLTNVGSPNLQIIPNGIWIINTFFSIDLGTAIVNAELYSYTSGIFTLLNTGEGVLINQGEIESKYTFSVPLTNPPSFSPSTRFAIKLNVSSLSGGAIITQYTTSIYLSSVSTTFPSGLGSLNSLISPSQTFITTTDANGDNFNISSSSCTHCFNLPSASATQVGALTCATWELFNCKQTTCYPPQSFYVNPTNAIATSITCKYFSCINKCLDTNISWTPSSASISIVPPIKGVQCGDYTIMRMGSFVYYCYSFYWSKGADGTISTTTTATNITFAFNNPSDVPRPYGGIGGGNNMTIAMGDVLLNPDEIIGNTYKTLNQPACTYTCNNSYQRGMIQCNTTCAQLPNLSCTRGILNAPYPNTFTYLSGYFVYQSL